MAYASITHVIAHNSARGTYTANTKPNVTAVTQFIDEAAGAIDFALTQAGYVSPLTGAGVPSSVQVFLQNTNAMGALCSIEKSAQVGHNEEKFCAVFKDNLKTIRTGQLPGVEKDASESLPRQGPVASPPYFTRDMDL